MKQKSTVSKILGLLALILLGVAGFFVGKMSVNAATNSIPLSIMLLTIALIIPAFLVAVAWR